MRIKRIPNERKRKMLAEWILDNARGQQQQKQHGKSKSIPVSIPYNGKCNLNGKLFAWRGGAREELTLLLFMSNIWCVAYNEECLIKLFFSGCARPISIHDPFSITNLEWRIINQSAPNIASRAIWLRTQIHAARRCQNSWNLFNEE